MTKLKYSKLPDSTQENCDNRSEITSDFKVYDSWKVFLSCIFLFVLIFYNISILEWRTTNDTTRHIEMNVIDVVTRGDYDTTESPYRIANESVNQFWVNTPHCRMPYVNPFTPPIKNKYKPITKTCPADVDSGDLVSVIYNANTREYLLHFNEDIARKLEKAHNSSAPNDIRCCYQEVVRSGTGNNADGKFNLLPCTNFHQDFVVPKHVDAMIVNCTFTSTNTTAQQDAFSFIQYRDNATHSSSATRKPSVLLIGIDSVSRINFRRTMPKTFEFVKQNNWLEMQGYNKMGDNTFPNVMALLTGFNLTTAYDVCKPKMVGGLNNPDCQMMWRYFKEAGYRTAYAEDAASMSTFNYLKRGFLDLPTDYYLRPLMLAVGKNMAKSKLAGMDFCVGRRQEAEYVYDFGRQFATQYADEPAFGLFWANSFSHNWYDAPSSMDTKMRKYMADLESSGILENAIIFFLSDHGMRWGELLSLPEGFFEERWPMFFIHLPKWFRNAHPSVVRALELNRNRLTSPYDINLTLKHILEMYDPELKLPRARDCPKCQSIFKPVPVERKCSDAGVDDHWCTCIPYHIAEGKASNKISRLIIDEMNKYIERKNLTHLCSPLSLKKIKFSYIRLQDEDDAKNQLPTYRIQYEVKEREARFEATCLYDKDKQSIHLLVEEISRLNSYAPDSQCTDDKQAKKYCICKDALAADAKKREKSKGK